MSYELYRLKKDGTAEEPVYPELQYDDPELSGLLDFDAMPENRFEISLFGMMRARTLALWNAEVYTSQDAMTVFASINEAKLDGEQFVDASAIEATDKSVVMMVGYLQKAGDVERKLLKSKIAEAWWVEPFTHNFSIAEEMHCDCFAAYLQAAVDKLREETICVFSEDQLNAYEALASFLRDSKYGVAVE